MQELGSFTNNCSGHGTLKRSLKNSVLQPKKALRIKHYDDIFFQNNSAMETYSLPVEETKSSTHDI